MSPWEPENRYLPLASRLLSRVSSSSSRCASSVARARLSLESCAPLPAWTAISLTRCSTLPIEVRIASSLFRLFFAAVMLVLYCPLSACSWLSCSRRTEATGSSAGVSRRLPVLICSWVRVTLP
ncbi:hypothetical protein D3C81_1703710 [compost metagenome]